MLSLKDDNYTEDEIDIVESVIDLPHIFSYKYDDHTDSLPYRSRVGQFKMPIHNGQRKLFLSSLMFLVKYSQLSKLVVYAGAAPGTNIVLLARLYPDIVFHLYDPRKFDPDLIDLKNVKLFQTYFTDSIAKSYNRKNILLWSDIRTGNIEDDDFEDQIAENNNMQRKWHDLSNPVMGMYKFRLPYAGLNTVYMKGDIWLQLWAPATSTETRLIVSREYVDISYSNKEYENRMYYFNLIDRQWKTYSKYQDINLMDVPCNCHDCTGEKLTLVRFLKSISKFSIENLQTLYKCISYMLKPIKHLHHGYIDKPIREKYDTIVKLFKDALLLEKEKKIKVRHIYHHVNSTKLIKET